MTIWILRSQKRNLQREFQMLWKLPRRWQDMFRLHWKTNLASSLLLRLLGRTSFALGLSKPGQVMTVTIGPVSELVQCSPDYWFLRGRASLLTSDVCLTPLAP